jgi:hypothetical protein
MKDVRVSKETLLGALKENREKHHSVFLEAQQGYRAAVITALDTMLTDAREGRMIRTLVELRAPVDQTRAYERAIAMLEMSEDTVIVVTERDFQCYVLDEWEWKHDFCTTNSAYVHSGEAVRYTSQGTRE